MRELLEFILSLPALNSLAGSLEKGRDKEDFPALVSGLGPVHRALFAASIFAKTGRPLFVICRDEVAAESFSRDLEALLGTKPAILISRDYTFYSAQGVSRENEQRRIAALYSAAAGISNVTVCPASALLQRAIPKKLLMEAAFTITDREKIAPEKVEEALLRCGYNKTQQVEGAGQFSRRGGILDFFSPAHNMPVRCEFWGDEIDSMAFFETGSQRRTDSIEKCLILPAAEVLPSMYPGGARGLSCRIEEISREISRKRSKSDSVREKLRETMMEDAQRLRECQNLAAADRYAHLLWEKNSCVADYIPGDAVLIMSDPGKTAGAAREYYKTLSEDVRTLASVGIIGAGPREFAHDWESAMTALSGFPLIMEDSFTLGNYPVSPKAILAAAAKQLSSYGGSAETAAGDVEHYLAGGYRVLVLASDERKAGLLSSFLKDKSINAPVSVQRLPEEGKCSVSVGSISAGFEFPEIKLAVLTDTQIVTGGFRRARRRKAASGAGRLNSYADMSVGDLVVHDYHGIGRFAGIIKMRVDGIEKDYVKISYAGSDSLYVPATQLDLVSKYIGSGEERPVKLSKMGGSDWSRAKKRARGAAKELAKGLIELYAQRQRIPGHAFEADSAWQSEFEERFGFEETEDQLRCVEEIKRDMERAVPMERLLCGDVGYGKTEVALRAAMKCILGGKQAAFLVPTTVLAQQHYQTATERFFGYPVNIEVLSRFKSQAQIKKALDGIKNGTVDLIIGTHRLIQKDVVFKDLGLLIVDEEQRFGVSHKERLKEMSQGVDVLTLSATPIPRTLNMALSGIRDMSTIEEPPSNRLPVQTYVMEHDWQTICDAIRKELSRGGQVYYLYNRVENIERVALRLSDMLEGASISVGHGQMDEESLSAVMEKMVSGECQVLVCTTIIETGIDIPNVNTLIIEEADKLGLAQLHQIRGRVGRSSRRASAYLTFRKNKVLSEVAEKRLSAIREFAEFNSGFKIAMRDLEIRGAGNLLGAEQSGHLITVGYDMYLKLLEEAVLEERGQTLPVRAECSADLSVTANIPDNFVPSPEQRMDLYRRIALIRTREEADDLTDEIIDRFGDPPDAVLSLIQVALLRGEATRAGISDISQKEGRLRFILTDFDMEKVSMLYARNEWKGRLKVEAGSKPCISLKLRSADAIIEQAREFVAQYKNDKN